MLQDRQNQPPGGHLTSILLPLVKSTPCYSSLPRITPSHRHGDLKTLETKLSLICCDGSHVVAPKKGILTVEKRAHPEVNARDIQPVYLLETQSFDPCPRRKLE
jgi:hypothetical protein